MYIDMQQRSLLKIVLIKTRLKKQGFSPKYSELLSLETFS